MRSIARAALFFVLVGVAASQWLIGTYARQKNNGLTQVVEINTGMPQIMRRFTLDMNGLGVTTKYPPAETSSQYAEFLGVWSDYYRIAGQGLQLNTTYNSSIDVPIICSKCDGVIGLGAGSPLWLFFPTVRLNARGLTFHIDSFTTGLDCALQTMCSTPMNVRVVNPDGSVAYEATHTVLVAMNASQTLLPVPVYQAVVGMRSVSTVARDAWPALELRGPESYGRFSPFEYLRNVVGTNAYFNTFSKTHGDAIVLGYQALLSVEFERDWATGKGRMLDTTITPDYSWISLVGMAMISVLYLLGHRSPVFFLKRSKEGISTKVVVVVTEAIAFGLAPAMLAFGNVYPVIFRTTVTGVLLIVFALYFSGMVVLTRLHRSMIESDDGHHPWVIAREAVRAGAYGVGLILLTLTTSTDRWFTPETFMASILATTAFVRGWMLVETLGVRAQPSLPFVLWFITYAIASAGTFALIIIEVYVPSVKWVYPAGGMAYVLMATLFILLSLAYFSWMTIADVERMWEPVLGSDVPHRRPLSNIFGKKKIVSIPRYKDHR